MRTIKYGDEYRRLHDGGEISRPSLPAPYGQPSGQWVVTGAVELSNFGTPTGRTWTLAEILADPRAIPWKHKNGAQRVHITDLDHGTHRMWGCPDHEVY
jgi:hypothetical protein